MYRGAAPIQWAVINGEKVSGNTTMLMDVGLDTGDMLLKDEINVTEEMTAGELYAILKDRGSSLLKDTINKMVKGELKGEKQSDETFYAKPLDKKMALINWHETTKNIHNLIRGLNPWPIAYTYYNGEQMKIYESKVLEENHNKEEGAILNVSKEGMKVACKGGVLLVKKVQFPNGKPLTIEQYINGHKIETDTILG
jgi:methionyl-tRNA formyltransferase